MRRSQSSKRKRVLQFCMEWRIFDYILCVVLGLGGWGCGRLIHPYCRSFSWTDTSIVESYGVVSTFPPWALILISVIPCVLYFLVEAISTFMCTQTCSMLDDYSFTRAPNERMQERNSNWNGWRRRGERRENTESQNVPPDGNTTQQNVSQQENTSDAKEEAFSMDRPVSSLRQVSSWKLFLHVSNHWILAHCFSVALTVCMADLLKVYAGRLRPDFLSRLEWLGYSPASVDVDWCEVEREGRLSFPSGHSAITFASMVPFSLYCMSQLRVFRGGSLWRAVAGLIPLFLPFIVAVSRTRDNRHHFSDVVAGGLIGSAAGMLSVVLLFVPSEKTGLLRVRQMEFLVKHESGELDDFV